MRTNGNLHLSPFKFCCAVEFLLVQGWLLLNYGKLLVSVEESIQYLLHQNEAEQDDGLLY